MSQRSQTIEIFLPDGEPRGLRLAGITTRIVQAIQCPRTKLDRLFARPEAQRVALYFLFGQTDESTKSSVYIGQTESLPPRLKTHNKEKDFWTSVVAITSRTDSFTQVHARYLEWKSIEQAQAAGRYTVENGNAGGRPVIPEPLEADVLDAFETAETLLAVLGCPVFEPLVSSQSPSTADDVFYCRRRGADAQGVFTDDGFILKQGSLCVQEVAEYLRNIADAREDDLRSGRLIASDKHGFETTEDIPCTSPSFAAAYVSGTSSNGWHEWKNVAGATLDEVYRESSDEEVVE